MPLHDDYLKYERRRYGYDHDYYAWSALKDRKPIIWPNGSNVAVCICVDVEFFPIIPNDTPFRAPGHMQTPFPDYRHYSARDYGTRIGLFRILNALKSLRTKASFACNSIILEKHKEIAHEIIENGHEVIAHGRDMNDTIASTLPIELEKEIIGDSIASIEKTIGKKPKGWLSISRSQSFATIDLLRSSGIEYTLDWVNDELPYYFKNGLINLPLNHELSDRQIINIQQNSADSYCQQILDAFDWLEKEKNGRILPINLTPYIMGLPYRIDSLVSLLISLIDRGAWFSTCEELVNHWKLSNENP